jgi:hypothetical protein
MEQRKFVVPPMNVFSRVFRKATTLCVLTMAAMLALPPAAPAQQRGNYYRGMHTQVRRGDYNRYSRDDEQRHHHDSGGGIGPGKGALIGTAGGAALGAIFGGSLKSTVLGGAAGAAAGAIGGAIADHDNNHKRR